MISENISQTKYRIQDALGKRFEKTGLVQTVEVIAVTKNQTVDRIGEAIDAGVVTIGENRVQEAMDKYAILQDRQLEWHMIGHLQTNKARQAVAVFKLIHSVDSERLAMAISNAASYFDKTQDVLMQVNIAEEDSKFGVSLAKAFPLAKYISQQKNIRLCGLMTIAPHFSEKEDTRMVFAQAYDLFVQLREAALPNCAIQWLSMGMTNDYEIAVQEGANIVRIGTGIFGERHY